MKDFLKALGNAALMGGIQGAASAAGSEKPDIRAVGISAGITSLIGILSFLANHPKADHPAVKAAVAEALPIVVKPSIMIVPEGTKVV